MSDVPPARVLPGQRGLPNVAPDVPTEDEDWTAAFDNPPDPDPGEGQDILWVMVIPKEAHKQAMELAREMGQRTGMDVVFVRLGTQEAKRDRD